MTGVKAKIRLPYVLFVTLIFMGCADADNRSDGGATSETAVIVKTTGDAYKDMTVNGTSFQWKIEDSTHQAILQAPAQGWVAVGFDPRRGMHDANIIRGYVNDAGVSIRDDFGTWFSSHDDDEKLGGRNDVLVLGGAADGEKTVLRFAIPLDSGDAELTVFRGALLSFLPTAQKTILKACTVKERRHKFAYRK